MSDKPTIAIEFWDGDDLVVAKFMPDGTATAHVIERTNSESLKAMKGTQIAQVSRFHDEVPATALDGIPEGSINLVRGSYQRLGEMEAIDEATIVENVASMMQDAEEAYEYLSEKFLSPMPKPTLN